MGNKEEVSDALERAKIHIVNARDLLLDSIQLMLGDNKHEFDLKLRPYITDEESCVRIAAESVTCDIVTLEDGTEMDIAEIGTDDLHSIADQIYSDIYTKS